MSTLGYFYLLVFVVNCLQAETSAQDFHRYFWANYFSFSNEPQKADKWFKEVLPGTDSMYPYKGYIHHLAKTGKTQELVAIAQRFEKSFAKDPDIQFIFAKSLARSGKKKQAYEKLITLNREFPTHSEIAMHVSQWYIGQKEIHNAIAVLDALLNQSPRKPNNFLFYFLKAQMHIQLQEKEKALAALKESLDLYPSFDKGWLLYALLHEQAGQLHHAINGYTTFLEVTGGTNTKIAKHLLQLAIKQKTTLFHTSNISVNKNCFEKVMLLFEQKQYRKALDALDNCITHKLDEKAILLKVQLLSSLGQFDSAISVLKTCILQQPDNQIWYQTIHLLCDSGLSLPKAIAAFKEIEQKKSGNVLVQLYLADLYLKNKQKRPAIIYLKRALRTSNDLQIKAKILFQMAAMYYEQKRFSKMEKTLKVAIEYDNQFVPAMNLLAYYWATKTNKVEQADLLAQQVFAIDPTNPHFLDTQAVIHYKKQEFAQAQQVLESIIKLVPGDYHVLKHLGKTYKQLGNPNKAKEHMDKALLVAHTSKQKQQAQKLLDAWK